MRIASFNILHGRSLADGRVDNDRLARACASLHADVLCLQEVDRGQHRSHGADQVGEVAAAMGATHARFAPALVGEPGATWRAADGTGTADAREPAYGIGLVSRLEVRGFEQWSYRCRTTERSWWTLANELLRRRALRAPVGSLPIGPGRDLLPGRGGG